MESGFCRYFYVNNENLFFTVDYHSKFPVVKKVESMLAENLIQATKVVFPEFGLHTGGGQHIVCKIHYQEMQTE